MSEQHDVAQEHEHGNGEKLGTSWSAGAGSLDFRIALLYLIGTICLQTACRSSRREDPIAQGASSWM